MFDRTFGGFSKLVHYLAPSTGIAYILHMVM